MAVAVVVNSYSVGNVGMLSQADKSLEIVFAQSSRSQYLGSKHFADCYKTDVDPLLHLRCYGSCSHTAVAVAAAAERPSEVIGTCHIVVV